MIEWLSERFNPGPVFGWLCLVFGLLIPLIWMRSRTPHNRPSVRFSSLAMMRFVAPSWTTRTQFVLPLLRTLAVLALIVALARPQAGGEYRSTREGIAIQMVLDVSGSMAAEDFLLDDRPARRIDVVKEVFRDFVLGRGKLQGRENDLIGMTCFAMYADIRVPLTLDHGSLIDLLDETDIPGWVNGAQRWQHMEANYTALGDAIVVATDDLRRAGEQAAAGVPGAEPARSRVMVLLTDGADNPARIPGTTPPDLLDAARVAAALGIRIYTIGAIGQLPSQSTRSRLLGFRDEVDEPTLKEIARLTGGQYFRATDVDSLVTIYEEIDKLERRRTGERHFQDHVYAAKLAMLAGLALLITELLLANTRYRKLP